MAGKLLVEQAHQEQILGAFALGLVIVVTAQKPQGLAAGLHQGALLGYVLVFSSS
ncbi:hypothetical protein [Hymenobacter arizonensis]|uniref:hypothetical protein n=1 Tax=Hymenobacter arizonensis TaxID=1227077 RepID=UPI0015A67193|nr:hypothetical protein [Hymenobacter arizonensis]